jgi:soluble lytic murein transglycosylase
MTLINCKKPFKILFALGVLLSFLFSAHRALAEDKVDIKKIENATSHPLSEFFFLKKENKIPEALEKLNAWKPSDPVEEFYKDYFHAQVAANPDQAVHEHWSLYLHLKKSKRLFRVQLDTLNNILDQLLNSKFEKSLPFSENEFKKEVKLTLKKVRGLPEGLDFELKFLKWIVKNNVSGELCKAERNRWLSQVNLKLTEVMNGVQKCKLTFDDFIYRMRMLVFSGAEKQAQTELNEFIEIEKLKDWEKAYLQAVYFSNVGDPTSAFEIVKKYEKELLNSEEYFDNLFYIAQRAGELSKAEEIINKIILKSKKVKEKKEFSYQKAFLFYQTKRYAEAIEILKHLVDESASKRKKRKNNEYDDLTWLKAWCYYLNKDYAQAKVSFLENKDWTRDKTRNLYWLAQTEWALDNQMKAIDYFKQLAQPLIDGKYFNYYNYLAWIRYETNKNLISSESLKNQIASLKSGRGTFMIPDANVNPMKVAEELKAYFEEITVTDEGDIQVINQDSVIASQTETEAINIETSAQLKKEVTWADHLLDWGYADFAKWHLYDVEKSFKTRKSAETLINYYLDKKFYYRALSLMQKVSATQDKKISLKEDELLWKAIYPKAYELNVKSEALLRKVDPYLIWSIMKAETQFKADAISPVGAVGLMQFMPYTSQKVALLLKENNHDPRTLFQPENAIQHGATYLRKLSREFDSQVPLVAAAYNGGPHRVKLWLRNLGDMDFDVFVEHIPFSETRTYVKRVLSFMKTYQKLYDEKQDYKKSQWLIEKNQYKITEPISLKEEWDFTGPAIK